MEAFLAAAASPLPPPVEDLVPDPTLTDLVPADLERLLRLVPTADLSLQDEVEVALHPTLTRVWCPKGRRGQRLVEAPGTNRTRHGFGLVDWRDGWLDWALAAGRRAAPFCAQLPPRHGPLPRAGPHRPRPPGHPLHPHPAGVAPAAGGARRGERGRGAPGAGLHPHLRPRRAIGLSGSGGRCAGR